MRRKEKEVSKLNAKANKARKLGLRSAAGDSTAAVASADTDVEIVVKAQNLCVGDVIQILWEEDMQWSVLRLVVANACYVFQSH